MSAEMRLERDKISYPKNPFVVGVCMCVCVLPSLFPPKRYLPKGYKPVGDLKSFTFPTVREIDSISSIESLTAPPPFPSLPSSLFSIYKLFVLLGKSCIHVCVFIDMRSIHSRRECTQVLISIRTNTILFVTPPFPSASARPSYTCISQNHTYTLFSVDCVTQNKQIPLYVWYMVSNFCLFLLLHSLILSNRCWEYSGRRQLK